MIWGCCYLVNKGGGLILDDEGLTCLGNDWVIIQAGW